MRKVSSSDSRSTLSNFQLTPHSQWHALPLSGRIRSHYQRETPMWDIAWTAASRIWRSQREVCKWIFLDKNLMLYIQLDIYRRNYWPRKRIWRLVWKIWMKRLLKQTTLERQILSCARRSTTWSKICTLLRVHVCCRFHLLTFLSATENGVNIDARKQKPC